MIEQLKYWKFWIKRRKPMHQINRFLETKFKSPTTENQLL